jgi:hypothetical protein
MRGVSPHCNALFSSFVTHYPAPLGDTSRGSSRQRSAPQRFVLSVYLRISAHCFATRLGALLRNASFISFSPQGIATHRFATLHASTQRNVFMKGEIQ